MKDLGDKLPADEKAKVETAITDLRRALEGDDASVVKSRTDQLAQASMKLGELLYKAQQDAPEASAEGSAEHDPDAKVVDADFTEVKDDKKSA
jgi:molecular chaperone DnaK